MKSLPESLQKVLLDALDEAVGLAEREADLRIALAPISDWAHKFRAMADMHDTPETRLVSFLGWEALRMAHRGFGGKKPDWYKVNEKPIKEFRSIYLEFLRKIRQAIANKDETSVVEGFMQYLFRVRKIVAVVTPEEE